MRAAVLLVIALVCAATGALRAADELAGPKKPLVAYIPVAREIDEQLERYVRRALDDAKAKGVTTVVVHLTTDGGTLDGGRKIASDLLNAGKGGLHTVAFVDDHCYSAGAMIAYANDEIRLTPHSTIGDIGVIMINQASGKIEYAPEKMETVVRELLRAEAQAKGWNAAKLVKMTAREQELYRFDIDGKQVFVLEDELETWLRDHPGVDAKSKVLVLGGDRLLTYTGKDAVEAGMATALADSLDDVYKALNVERAQVLDLSPTSTELMSWKLAGFAPILIALAALCVFLEFKMGGTGLFLIGAAVLGALFLGCQYYQELASYPELILMLLGVLCVAAELFFFPSAGWLMVLGLTLACSGLVLSFMPDVDQFHPDAADWGDELASALKQSVLALAVITVGAVTLFATLPNSRAMRRLAAKAEIGGTSAGELEAQAATVVGKRAVARTPLSPSGAITLDGRDVSATTEHGEFLEAGAAVVVVAMRYGSAVVRAADAGRQAKPVGASA
jgi:membrane-bound serine protease (ClpP class)